MTYYPERLMTRAPMIPESQVKREAKTNVYVH
jgi:hypothetical protein